MIVNLNTSETPKKTATVRTLREASVAVRAVIEETGIGASGMRRHFGDVSYDDGDAVAHVSYNGRIWIVGGYADGAEIVPFRKLAVGACFMWAGHNRARVPDIARKTGENTTEGVRSPCYPVGHYGCGADPDGEVIEVDTNGVPVSRRSA